MEKPFNSMSTRSKLRIRVTPKELREAANRLENELRNNTLRNQEAELEFSPSITFYAEHEPAEKPYFGVSTEDRERNKLSQFPVLN